MEDYPLYEPPNSAQGLPTLDDDTRSWLTSTELEIRDGEQAHEIRNYLYMETVPIQTLIGQFERDLPAKSLEGTEFEKAAIVSSDLRTEWKKYRQLLTAKR